MYQAVTHSKQKKNSIMSPQIVINSNSDNNTVYSIAMETSEKNFPQTEQPTQ